MRNGPVVWVILAVLVLLGGGVLVVSGGGHAPASAPDAPTVGDGPDPAGVGEPGTGLPPVRSAGRAALGPFSRVRCRPQPAKGWPVRVVRRGRDGEEPAAGALVCFLDPLRNCGWQVWTDLAKKDRVHRYPPGRMPGGWFYRADAEGRVRIPSPKDLAYLLFGWSGDECGALRPNHEGGIFNQDPPLRLLLKKARWLQVEVVGQKGGPRRGVPVALSLAGSGYGGSTFMQTTDTDREGRASLLLPEKPSRWGRLVTTVRLPFGGPVREEVDHAAVLGKPVRLVLPPTGIIVVAMGPDRGRLPGEEPYGNLRVLGPSGKPIGHFYSGRVVNSGRRGRVVRFPFVGLGLQVQIRGGWLMTGQRTRKAITVQGAGPTRAGQEVHFDCASEDPDALAMPILTGRVTGPDGRPIRRESLRLFRVDYPLDSLKSERNGGVDLDGKGRFHWACVNAKRPVTRRVLEIRTWDIPPQVARLDLAPTYPNQRVDLGDIRLETAPFLLSGRVVDGAGKPLSGALLILLRHRPGLPTKQWVNKWCHLPRVQVRTDLEGRFAVYSKEPPGSLALEAHAKGHAWKTHRCRQGAKDLCIRLTPVVQVLLPVKLKDPEAWPRYATLTLELPLADPIKEGAQYTVRESPIPNRKTASVTFHRVPEGSASLYLTYKSRRSHTRIQLLQGLSITPKPGESKVTLPDLHLERKVRMLRLKVMAGGMPAREGVVRCPATDTIRGEINSIGDCWLPHHPRPPDPGGPGPRPRAFHRGGGEGVRHDRGPLTGEAIPPVPSPGSSGPGKLRNPAVRPG